MNAVVVPAMGPQLCDGSEIDGSSFKFGVGPLDESDDEAEFLTDRLIAVVKQAGVVAGPNMISRLKAFTASVPAPMPGTACLPGREVRSMRKTIPQLDVMHD